ncbi:MAG: OmpA family protein [Rhizobacter sp.]|nr:OmpA family protein [Bacteriovorax sp.]
MADEKAPIIIKKINKAHAGAHGGAWKVAFADFMTAMMCFFLVMWLMGADEETKAAIADYFTTATIFHGGSDSLGKVGSTPNSATSVLNGGEGAFDQKDVTEPARPRPVYLQEHKVLSKLVDELFDGNAFSADYNSEYLKFAIPGNIVFQFGSTEISYEGKNYLKKLSDVFKDYEGTVSIVGHTEKGEGATDQANWDLSFKRAMAIRTSLIKDFGVRGDKLIPVAQSSETQSTDEEEKGININRRVEFILRHKNF